MYRNRMPDLMQYVSDPSIIGSKLRDSIMSDVITQAPENTLYTVAKQQLNMIKDVTLHLERSAREYYKATRPQKQKQVIHYQRAIHEKINTKISEGNNLMKDLKNSMQKINAEYKSQNENGDTSSVVQYNRVSQDTTNAMKQFMQAQQKITQQIKSTVHRQAVLIKGEQISQNELQHLVLHPQSGQQMLKEKLLDSPSIQLENAVSDIIDKCNDIKKLEKNIRECMSMMEEMALLVQLQGDKLTTIEAAIDGAKEYVDKGDVSLQKGKQNHKKSKKKMCCIMMILLVIIGVIVIPIIITQVK